MNKSTLALDTSHLLLSSPPLPPFHSSFLMLCSAPPGQDPHLLQDSGKRLPPLPLAPWLIGLSLDLQPIHLLD